MDGKIRVGAVSYLNTKPLLYGIEHSAVGLQIELIIDYPASIATMLQNGEIDMGLVPVAIIPFLQEYHINGNYCIGSDGPVASVCLFSDVPIDQVDRVLLDYQSRTSVQLARILLRDLWKRQPELIDTGGDFQSGIKGRTAGVVIGDRALEQRRKSPFVYDLAEGWKMLTGLPFVFAAWISNKPIDAGFMKAFDEANLQGILQLDKVVAENPYPHFNLHDYFTRHLDYRLDEPKRRGLEKFLAILRVMDTSAVAE